MKRMPYDYAKRVLESRRGAVPAVPAHRRRKGEDEGGYGR
jgi:hypothetical protein